ncbi:hypothetical protein Tco_0019472 [Tanacetum coccineum]
MTYNRSISMPLLEIVQPSTTYIQRLRQRPTGNEFASRKIPIESAVNRHNLLNDHLHLYIRIEQSNSLHNLTRAEKLKLLLAPAHEHYATEHRRSTEKTSRY